MKRFSAVVFTVFFWLVASGVSIAGDWLDNANGYARGQEQAVSGAKPIMLYFYTDWCPHCREFEKSVLSHPEVQQALSGFIKVRVNPEKGSRESQLADKYHIDGYPAVFFSNPASRQMTQEMTQAVRSPTDFANAANQFLRTARSADIKKEEAKPITVAAKSKTVSLQVDPEQKLYLKNGRVLIGKVVSDDGKGMTFAVQGLDNVYFSNSEILKVEKIKE